MTLDAALDAGPQVDTTEEFEALEGIRTAVESSGDDGLAAIVPLGYLPSVNAIVMERLDAVPLRSLVGRPRHRRMGELFERSGRWLKLYHGTVGGAAEASVDPVALTARVLTAVAAVPVISVDTPAIDRLFQSIGSLGGRRAVIVRSHGDFSLANVLVTTDRRVASLDPNRYLDLAEADLARCIADMFTLRVRAVSLGRYPTDSMVDAWQGALLAGYGDVDAAVLCVMVAIALVERWADFETAPPSRLRRAALPLMRRMFSTELERALRSVKSVERPA